MYRLGLRLILQGGKEALVRLMLTMVAVAVGVTILLGVLADFHAYQQTSNRPSWESTSGESITAVPSNTPNAELWHYSENIYKGQFIEQLDIAPLGQNAPMLPGISQLPKPGQYYASPALARLIQTVPKDELGNRFPGKLAGTIGQPALSFPTELAIYVGHTPNQMALLPGTVEVTHISTVPQLQGTTNIYRMAFGIGALAVLFPLLILVNTATRLAASRREERYAAMRLVGATPHQINVIASVDALSGALLGAILGTLIYLAVQPAIKDIAFSGVQFFPNYVTPTIWGYLAMIILVPVIAAIASLISLRRVQISPLGVSRKTTPKKPKSWRVIPLILGIILFPYGATKASGAGSNGPAMLAFFAGFLLIMVGLVLSGSWLTMQMSRLLAKSARRAPSLLAARRLSDNPKGAFRAISGLVLAVFIGSVVSVLVPALNLAQNPSGKTSLSNVLRVPYNTGPQSVGLSPQDSTKLVHKVESYSGTTVVPIYNNPAFLTFLQQQAPPPSKNGPPVMAGPKPNIQPPDDSIVSCASIKLLSVLGSCPANATAVTFNSGSMLQGDNPLYIYGALPVVTSRNARTQENTQKLSLAGILIKANNADTLEQIRTYLTVYNAQMQSVPGGKGGDSLSAWQMGVFEPETVGEVAKIRSNDDTNVGRAVLAIIALTLLTAGCSLAVTIGGSLVERKRAFALLRVTGVPIRTLYSVILLEAALPLVVVSLIAAGIGLSVGIPVVRTLLDHTQHAKNIPVHPSAGYYITLGVGMVVALGLVVLTLPLLNRMTRPEEARFE